MSLPGSPEPRLFEFRLVEEIEVVRDVLRTKSRADMHDHDRVAARDAADVAMEVFALTNVNVPGMAGQC